VVGFGFIFRLDASVQFVKPLPTATSSLVISLGQEFPGLFTMAVAAFFCIAIGVPENVG
jgi:hypothetical protein